MKFANQVQSKVTMTDEQNNSYNIAGINGTISSADSVIGGLSAILDIVGWQVNDVVRVVNQDVVEGEAPAEPTLEPTLTVSNTGLITYNGDGQLFAQATANNIFLNITDNQITAKNAAGNTPTSYSCIVYASPGNNYVAKSVTFTYGG